MQPKTLDHVAFWVADRARIVAFCERHLGHARDHERGEVHADRQRTPGRGKLTLFDAEGPAGAGAAQARRTARLGPRGGPRGAAATAGRGRASSSARGSRHARRGGDRRRVRPRPRRVLVARPGGTAREYVRYGFAPAARLGRGRRRAASSSSRASPAPLSGRCSTTSPCSSIPPTSIVADAEELGIEVESVVDAANTYAAFLWGPDACASSTSSTSRRSRLT